MFSLWNIYSVRSLHEKNKKNLNTSPELQHNLAVFFWGVIYVHKTWCFIHADIVNPYLQNSMCFRCTKVLHFNSVQHCEISRNVHSAGKLSDIQNVLYIQLHLGLFDCNLVTTWGYFHTWRLYRPWKYYSSLSGLLKFSSPPPVFWKIPFGTRYTKWKSLGSVTISSFRV